MKRKKRKKKPALNTVNQMPGKVVYVGEKGHLPTSFEIITYNKQTQDRWHSTKVDDIVEHQAADQITWVNVNGLNNTKAIEKLGEHFGLHPLILEDIADTQQRPKIDEYDNYLFVVLKMLYKQNDSYASEHVSLVVGPNYLLTFQESESDVFDGLRERIRNGRGLVRNAKSDYLMYALVDAIIDNYFIIIETLGMRIENLEDSLFLGDPGEDIVQDIQHLKREIIQLRRTVFPLREVTSRIEKSDHNLISLKTYNYLRDLHDHSSQVSENIEVYREMIWGLMDMYMSTISNKMNEVMKVLTIMASIFIPLTFLAGIYGMNFDDMPELHWKYGYFYVLGIMLLVFVAMVWYFKRKKWL